MLNKIFRLRKNRGEKIDLLANRLDLAFENIIPQTEILGIGFKTSYFFSFY